MSKQGLEAFLGDVLAKRSFAAQVGTDPSILNGYDLTLDEKRALRQHDAGALQATGVAPDLLRGLDAVPLADEAEPMPRGPLSS